MAEALLGDSTDAAAMVDTEARKLRRPVSGFTSKAAAWLQHQTAAARNA
jgi:hypothetical protein